MQEWWCEWFEFFSVYALICWDKKLLTILKSEYSESTKRKEIVFKNITLEWGKKINNVSSCLDWTRDLTGHLSFAISWILLGKPWVIGLDGNISWWYLLQVFFNNVGSILTGVKILINIFWWAVNYVIS